MAHRPTLFRRTKRPLLAVLLTGSAFLAPCARADDQSESLELMEKQIARIQAQQAALTHALAGLQKQLVAKKNTLRHGPDTHAALSRATRQRIIASGRAPAEMPETGGEEETERNTTVVHHQPDVTPTFHGVDRPTVEVVTARREEDIISRSAENNVGPHARETVGAQAAGAVGNRGIFRMGPIVLALGGFIDTASVLENRHIASGTFNYWQGMPYPNDPRYHTNNFEGGARYSRISLMARGNVSKTDTISGFFEMDFGAGAATTDAYESNSYAFRLRQAYLAYDSSATNTHFLAGQAWSLLTPNRVGIIPRQESLPETIEASMLAGQTWARQWQARFVKDMLHHRLWLGLSIENAQTLYDTGGFSSAGTDGAVRLPNGQIATLTADGTGLTNSAPFSNEIAPDVIAKIAYDPSWGHYELEGILHFPHDRVSDTGYGHNNTVIAGGGGGSMIVPIIPHKLEVRLAGLAGVGIGRYGSVILPDVTLNAQGKPVPLPSVQASAGIIAHPSNRLDVYGYFGTQREGRRSFSQDGNNYGYGNPLYSNAGCNIEMSSLPCSANTRGVMEATIGAWWRFFKGDFGTVEAGAQLAYSRRQIWNGVGGDPSTSMSQIFFDFRYLPFQ